MSVSIICHSCGHCMELAHDFDRRKIRCPQCGVYCEVPAKPAKDSGARKRSKRAEPRPEASAIRPGRTGAQEPVSPPPARPLANKQAPSSREDSPDSYRVSSGEQRKCPECGHKLATDAKLCPACDLDLETGEKVVKTYARIERYWEAGLPFRRRLTIFIGCQAFVLPLGLLGAILSGQVSVFLFPWITFTALLAFILGTFDRLDLSRNRRGQVRLLKTWRIFFFARPAATIPLREYEGIATGTTHDASFVDWIVLVCLFPFGIVPAILWWVFVIHPDNFFVALCKNHGYPELPLYQGMSESKVRDIALTLRDVAELPYASGLRE